jgi:transposase
MTDGVAPASRPRLSTLPDDTDEPALERHHEARTILITKRLEDGRFKWPPVTDGVVRLSALQLSVLLSGLPWERLQAPSILRPTVAC